MMTGNRYASEMLKLHRLRRVRQLRFLSLKDLSARAGVSMNTISRIERGGSAQYDTAKKLCEALEVDVKELVGDE
jgi:transcriptional regulator with XRE-family HTH domain